LENNVSDIKNNFEAFLNSSQSSRLAAEKRRDYRDLKQWTEEQVNELQERGQAAIVFDQFSKKIDGLNGLEISRRSDPKAFPVTPIHAKAADAISDALRYVETNTSFDEIGTEVFEDKVVEGYGGVIIEIKDTPKGKEIDIVHIPWDRIYYDVHSRRKDFRDATYLGISLWMDVEDAKELESDTDIDWDNIISHSAIDGDFADDKPNNWVDYKRKRVRVNQEFRLKSGKWHEVWFTGHNIILNEKESPYLDCDDEPMCPIELQSDFVDRDNNRYGYSARLMDPQDEINHRRSKALFMLSSKTVIADKGAFGNASRNTVLDWLRKGFSFLEKIPGAEVNIDSQQDLGQSQLAFYQDAQQAMDSVGANPELTGSTDNAISGRAFIARQQGGMVEVAGIFSRHSEWKRRVYRQCWARIKQFWGEEKWIRVTDEEEVMRFVGLNQKVTYAELALEEQSGQSIETLRADYDTNVDKLIEGMIEASPQMAEIAETRNNVPELDMDIMLEEAPDTITIQQEQFETLAQLAGSRVDPPMFRALLKMSTMRNKDAVLEELEGKEEDQEQVAEREAQAAKIQELMLQLEIQGKQTDTENTQADTELKQASAMEKKASAMQKAHEISKPQEPTQ